MNLLKKIPLMAFVLGLGFTLSMSSFVKSSINTNRAQKTYYHVGNIYQETQPAGTSCKSDDFSCRIVFTGTNLPSGDFNEGSTPTSPDYSSVEVQANASYKP